MPCATIGEFAFVLYRFSTMKSEPDPEGRVNGARRERWQQVPPGMRDLPSGEASGARVIIDRILSRMGRWGYREVVTPSLEYLDTLVRGEGTEAGDRLFKLVDRGGELLALRPEMTTPVARFITTHLRDHPVPLRIAYAGQVFRGSEAGSGRLREFPQVGCELVGAGTLEADAEIVALAVEALAASGAPACSVSLGHVGFLRGMLAGLDLPEDGDRQVRACLYRKDFVGLRAMFDRYGVPAPTSSQPTCGNSRSRPDPASDPRKTCPA